MNTVATTFRTAQLGDAQEIWLLVRAAGVLDTNSLYCYLLLCRDFGCTSVVAHQGSQLVGFVTAYRPPARSEVTFVWQIGVAEEARGQGLARRILQELVSLPACADVAFLEATVTPSNTASQRLFRSFAEKLHVPCIVESGFSAELFGGGTHEREDLFRIGPLK